MSSFVVLEGKLQDQMKLKADPRLSRTNKVDEFVRRGLLIEVRHQDFVTIYHLSLSSSITEMLIHIPISSIYLHPNGPSKTHELTILTQPHRLPLNKALSSDKKTK